MCVPVKNPLFFPTPRCIPILLQEWEGKRRFLSTCTGVWITSLLKCLQSFSETENVLRCCKIFLRGKGDTGRIEIYLICVAR